MSAEKCPKYVCLCRFGFLFGSCLILNANSLYLNYFPMFERKLFVHEV